MCNLIRIIYFIMAVGLSNTAHSQALTAGGGEVSVAINSGHMCVLYEQGVKRDLACWGRSNLMDVQVGMPKVEKPTHLAVEDGLGCVIDDGNLKCWGVADAGIADAGSGSPPPLQNVKDVSVGFLHGCALAEGKVVCWGRADLHKLEVPELVNPTKVSSGEWHNCAIEDRGVVCWGGYHPNTPYGGIDSPPLKNPTQLVSGNHHTCALHDGGVSCWAVKATTVRSYGQTNVPPLSHPRHIAAGDNHACALDDNGITCWGDSRYHQLDVPDLEEPQAVYAGGNVSCALLKGGVLECWGELRPSMFPIPEKVQGRLAFFDSFSLETLDESYREIAKLTYSYKGSLLRSVAEYISGYPIDHQHLTAEADPLIMQRGFLLCVIQPLIEETRSPVFEEWVITQHQKSVQNFTETHGLSDVTEIPYHDLVGEASLMVVSQALRSSLSFATASQQRALKTLIGKLGVIAARSGEHGDRLDPAALYAALSEHSNLIDELALQQRTRGLAGVVSSVKNYLEGTL